MVAQFVLLARRLVDNVDKAIAHHEELLPRRPDLSPPGGYLYIAPFKQADRPIHVQYFGAIHGEARTCCLVARRRCLQLAASRTHAVSGELGASQRGAIKLRYRRAGAPWVMGFASNMQPADDEIVCLILAMKAGFITYGEARWLATMSKNDHFTNLRERQIMAPPKPPRPQGPIIRW